MRMIFRKEKGPVENGFKVIESRRIEVVLPHDFGENNCVMSVIAAAINTLCDLKPGRQITGQQIITMLEGTGFDYNELTSSKAMPSLLELIKSGLGYEIKCRNLSAHADFGQHLFGTIKREIKIGRLVSLGIRTAEYWLKEVRGFTDYEEDWSFGHRILISGYSVLEIGGRREIVFEVNDPYSIRAKTISTRLSDLQEAIVDGPVQERLIKLVIPVVSLFSLGRD